MVNGLNTQYMQNAQYQAQQVSSPQVQTSTAPSGAVCINIYNPTTTNGQPIYNQNSYYTPGAPVYPYQPKSVVDNGNSGVVANANSSANVNVTTPSGLNNNQGTIPQGNNQAVQQPEQGSQPKAKDEETAKKVILTDEYIMSLENYLNDENPKIRLMGIKEVLDRFKEDKSRASDMALTALMNKALQDPSATVRYISLAILDSGYATGNEETVQILKNMQANSDKQYAEDSLAASDVLLKMSHNTVEVPKGTGW